MIKPPKNEFANKADAFAHAKKHGGKVMKKTFTHPTTGDQNVSYVVKEEVEEPILIPDFRAIDEVIKGGETRDITPDFFVTRVENMCAVLVDGDAIDDFGVDIAADMRTFLED